MAKNERMAEQYSEIITGNQEIINALQPLIDSRIVSKMGIPRAKQSWITLLLEIRSVGRGYNLLIDRVTGFEKTLLNFPDKEVSLNSRIKQGFPVGFIQR